MLVRRFSKIVFAPLFVLAAGALILGGCRHGGHCGWGSKSPEEKADRMVKKISKELDLNDQQKAGLEKIKGDFLARKADFEAVKAGFHEELAAQIRSGAIDKAKLNQSLSAREAKVQELRVFVVDEFAEFHALLDAGQREKLAKHVESQCRR